MAAGCRSGVPYEQCLVGWCIDQVHSDAWCVNVLKKTPCRTSAQDDPIFDSASAA